MYLICEKVKEECTKLNNQNVITVQTDVTDSDSVSNLFEIAKEKFEKLDVLINNAGVFDGGPCRHS
ncbi:MAG: SDR family NAD(P)-dependent oxidoreductase [Dehalococcoidia bacterium]